MDIVQSALQILEGHAAESLAGQMRPGEVDIVHSALQILEGHEPHPAGTRFVTRDTLCMCVCQLHLSPW